MWTEQETQEEITELTDQLRSDPSWEQARQMLLTAGHDPNELLLLSFMENEEGLEWGLFLKPGNRVFEWEVETNDGYRLNSISEKFEGEFENYGSAVSVGIAMISTPGKSV